MGYLRKQKAAVSDKRAAIRKRAIIRYCIVWLRVYRRVGGARTRLIEMRVCVCVCDVCDV